MLQQVTLLLSKNHLSPVKYRNSIYFNKIATMRSLNNNHVLSQSSVQVQRAVQRKPAFVQEHLPWHPFLHPHLTSSWHDFVTSGNVVQNGFQMPQPLFLPTLVDLVILDWALAPVPSSAQLDMQRAWRVPLELLLLVGWHPELFPSEQTAVFLHHWLMSCCWFDRTSILQSAPGVPHIYCLPPNKRPMS